MGSSEHTQGPWTVLLRGERGTFHVVEAQKHEAEHTDDGVDGYTVSKANANLIAASPEMYAALTKIRDRRSLGGRRSRQS
jgi:hypothetical protein